MLVETEASAPPSSIQPDVKLDGNIMACECITAVRRQLSMAAPTQVQWKSAGDDTFPPATPLNNLQNNRLLGDSFRRSQRKALMLTFSRGRGKETKMMHPILHAAQYQKMVSFSKHFHIY